MADIRYVVLSDMHLGDANSLFTRPDPNPDGREFKLPPAMEGLIECLRVVINRNSKGNKPVLILCGDVFDRAVSAMDRAVLAFETFIRVTMKRGQQLFSEIVFLPGNHDHHLWELDRETHYLDYLNGVKPGQRLSLPRFTTEMFLGNRSQPIASRFLTGFLQRLAKHRSSDYSHLAGKPIQVFYPNLALRGRGDKCIVLTHGHYVEDLSKLMSIFGSVIMPGKEPPPDIDALELENSAWIDFLWSTMCRSGPVGNRFDFMYRRLRAHSVPAIVELVTRALVQRHAKRGWKSAVEAWLARWVMAKITKIMAKRAETRTAKTIWSATEEGLKEYLTGPVYNQIIKENGRVPEDLTVIFGHTHQPFASDFCNLERFPSPVKVYNTGGWVLATAEPVDIYGGATVLIDEDLNTTSLHLYQQGDSPEDGRVRVIQAGPNGNGDDYFHNSVADLVDYRQEPWKSFSAIIAQEVSRHAALTPPEEHLALEG